jgi:hypothetical protein
MKRFQSARCYTAVDRIRAHADMQELGTGQDAMLAMDQRSKRPPAHRGKLANRVGALRCVAT